MLKYKIPYSLCSSIVLPFFIDTYDWAILILIGPVNLQISDGSLPRFTVFTFIFFFQENADASTFKCAYCASDFEELKELTAHLENGHQQKMLSCHLCKAMFLNYGSFR